MMGPSHLEVSVPLYVLDDLVPTIHPDAWVHPDAVIIGDVRIGAQSTVWPGAVLRGDHGHIAIGERTSIQDGTVVHTTKEFPTTIGSDVVIGHVCHLEGCVVEDWCLIGSGSVVLNRSRVGTLSVVGAQALVTEGLQVPPRSKVFGTPGKVRPMPEDEDPRRYMTRAVDIYVHNGEWYRNGLRHYDPAVDRPLHPG
jgi:carbonic anhydrase/acetyltransferase-like protein (isoleucine patch superfamily)